MTKYFIVTLLVILLSSCASLKIEDIPYQINEGSSRKEAHLLNVFTPKKPKTNKSPVIIFIHGGYWEEGNKDIYGFLGRNFAKHDVVTVIPNYTLSPNTSYDGMAKDVVKAIRWTQIHISEYGGDAQQIYLMGHSAGGHLIALVTTNAKFGIQQNAIKGVILNDAAGLDMKTYLDMYPPTSKHHYDITWTTNPDNWKDASPVYFLNKEVPKFLIYVGQKTYPSIKSQNQTFVSALKKYQPEVNINYLDKKHVPMMSHLFFPWVNRYEEIQKFMEE